MVGLWISRDISHRDIPPRRSRMFRKTSDVHKNVQISLSHGLFVSRIRMCILISQSYIPAFFWPAILEIRKSKHARKLLEYVWIYPGRQNWMTRKRNLMLFRQWGIIRMAEPLLKEVDYFAILATLHDYVENARIFGQFGGFGYSRIWCFGPRWKCAAGRFRQTRNH